VSQGTSFLELLHVDTKWYNEFRSTSSMQLIQANGRKTYCMSWVVFHHYGDSYPLNACLTSV